MNKLFILNGTGETGKDTFVDFIAEILLDHNINTKVVSSVEKVKDAAWILGWDGKKDAKSRKFLSDLKDMSTELYDGPMKFMESRVKDFSTYVLFFMIREPKEIKKFVEKYPETKTVLMTKPDHLTTGNHADENVHLYDYDIEISNDGTLSELNQSALKFVNRYILEI